MTRSTVTTWTCDRCGAFEEHPQNRQPPGWLGVLFGTPPEGDPMDRKWKRLHFCPACDAASAEFMRLGREEQVVELRG